MRSEIFPGSSSPTCVRFWFYTKAVSSNTELGTLNVFKYNYLTQTNNILWSVKYGQGVNWLEGIFSYIDTQKHSIIFEGIKGLNLGDIALDDIQFFPNSFCNLTTVVEQPTTSPSTLTTAQKSTTTYSWSSQSQYDCNFENGICSWQNDPTANFFWKLTKGSNNYYSGF